MTAEGHGPPERFAPEPGQSELDEPVPGLGTWEWDARTGQIWWSDEIYRILGIDRASFAPDIESILAFTLEEDRWVHEPDAAYQRVAPYSIYFRVRRADGSIRTLREIGGASPTWTPESPRIIGTIMDVTEYGASTKPGPVAGPAQSGTWRWDSRSGAIQASTEALEILGLSAEGMTCEQERSQLMHPEDRARTQEIYEHTRAARPAAIHQQYRIVRPNGAVRTIEEHGLLTDGGFYDSRITDVTERTRLERNLVRVQNLARLGSWEYDPRSDTLWWSDQTYRLLGFEPGDVIPSTQILLSRVHPGDVTAVRAALDAAQRKQAAYSVNYRVRLPDGTIRFMVDQGEFQDGLEVGLLMDVTEHRRTERNLAEAQRIAALGSWEIDSRTGDIRWSDEMYRLFGVAPKSISLSVALWTAHIHAEDRERVRAAYAETARTNVPYSVQYRLIRADNQIRYVQEACDITDVGFAGYVIDITERHKAQRHLAKAQEIARIGGWEWDPATDHTWMSDELYHMLGLDPANWSYSLERWLVLVHPQDRERVRSTYTSPLARSEGFAIQFQLRQPDGSYRLYFEQSELNDGGTVTGILWDITDITRAQRNMAEAQRIARIGSWEWDVERDEHWWSAECYRILGYDRKSVAASDAAWDALTHPQDLVWKNVEFDEAVRNRRPYSYQYRIIRPDGQVRTVFESGEPITVEKYAGTVMDVTDRVKIETRLAEAQRIAKLGSWEWNTATDERWWSDECYRIYDVPASTRPITRQVWSQAIHPDDLPALHELIGSVERNPRPYTYRCRIRRRDGTLRTVQVHGEPVSDFNPSNPIVAGTILDITDRESIENQLHQAQKMEAVGQLTGGIAHDFNNLLGAILGNLDLMMDEIETRSRARTLATRAIAAAESGAQLVRQLLAFSRKQALNPQVIDVNELVTNVLDLLRRTLGGKVQVETALAPMPLYCLIDRPQTEGALLNLCINARDAMATDGTVRIASRAVAFDGHSRGRPAGLQSGRYVELSVSDTGAGMLPEVMERAFEPFYTTKAAGQGSGLGLSMVYGFVKQSEGHVAIESEPGSGTTVRLFLPQHHGRAVPARESAATPPQRSDREELILVVEDNADLRGYAVNSVLSFGYRALSASTAGAAMRLIESRPDIALLFTDIVFKDGPSGIQLADMARRHRPDLRVLLTSGYLGDREVRERADLAGTYTIGKPFRAPELGRKLAEIFGAGSGAGARH